MRFKLFVSPSDASDIQSLRIGHATNSSSAHSVVFHPKAGAGETRLSNTSMESIDEHTRDKYVFTSARDKALLIFASDLSFWRSAHAQLSLMPVLERHGLAHDILAEAAKLSLPVEATGADLLRVFQGHGISANDWLDFMLSSNVTMIGYDDNYDSPAEQIAEEGIGFELDSSLRWRKDGGAIVAYDPGNGAKLRWGKEDYTKSETPELVDVKITDACSYGCSFCYQGSTKEGLHAPYERIVEIFDQLKALDVFEVAIGGGEPAQHPDFARIIRAAHERNLTFNFTAYGLDWLKNPEIIEAIADSSHMGVGMGVGISVHSERDISKVERAREELMKHRLWRVEVMGQTVVGATPFETIEALLAANIDRGFPLLLLGFKETGRGAGHARQPITEEQMTRLLTTAREAVRTSETWNARNFHLSVDTAFLDEYGPLLDKLDVPHSLRTSPEGKFSMYIDAVTDRCAPSSYCDPALMQPRGDIRAQFASY